MEDDLVVQTVQAMTSIPMKLDRVPALTDKTFPEFRNGPTSVILFYFPCKSLNLHLSKQMTTFVAILRVCIDSTDSPTRTTSPFDHYVYHYTIFQ